jgi:tetratricopeptide (TPR) repeat protein
MLKPSNISLGVVMAVCAVIPAWADDLALCLDKQVEACTRLIDSGKFDQTNLANLFTARGIAHKAGGEFEHAFADYSEAIRLDPRNAIAFVDRGAAHEAKGELELALADDSEAIRLDPRNAIAFYNRGVTYEKKRELDLAIADFSEATRINPTFALAFNSRGAAHQAKGEGVVQKWPVLGNTDNKDPSAW